MTTATAEAPSIVEIGPHRLEGMLVTPRHALGLVIFAHGSGSSRLSPRNARVSKGLNQFGLATLRFDLLTSGEARDRANVFDIALLARRLLDALQWSRWHAGTRTLPVGLFGASTGAAAALVAAADSPIGVGAVVSRGGRPDLAGDALARVRAPVLLIVGGSDHDVLERNEAAFERLHCEKALTVVPGATHLFEEPGALEEVIADAGEWFERHLALEAD